MRREEKEAKTNWRHFDVGEIPHSENIVSTIGDWRGDNIRQLKVTISKMPGLLFWPVFFHEFTEIAVCEKDGVKPADCHAFDDLWEEEIKQGLHGPEEEAGFDPRCPYRLGHEWGAFMEKLMCQILSIDFDKYCEFCEEIFK